MKMNENRGQTESGPWGHEPRQAKYRKLPCLAVNLTILLPMLFDNVILSVAKDLLKRYGCHHRETLRNPANCTVVFLGISYSPTRFFFALRPHQNDVFNWVSLSRHQNILIRQTRGIDGRGGKSYLA